MARPAKLSNATLEALTAELERRQKALPKLEAKAAELRAELESVEAEIAMLGGSGKPARRGRKPGRRRGRPARAAAATSGRGRRGKKAKKKVSRKTGRRRGRPAGGEGTLSHAVAQVTSSTPMSPKEIKEAILSKGLRKETATMGTQISQVLSKGKQFKKKGRGQWVNVG
ncbi:MAG: hypothetical protein ACO3Y3_04990 [Phycisphaerales bacterium]|jgi:hypothetical protein